MIVFGFDPGGKNSFGWAAARFDLSGGLIQLATGVVSTAPAAVNAALSAAGEAPVAIGIDAPLFWVEAGDRYADRSIRKRVTAAGGSSGTVSSVNSLMGACLSQGIITARICSRLWPCALLTEAHPKALLRLSPSAGQFVRERVPPGVQEHQRDAALAAYAAWHAVQAPASWRDLVLDEKEPFFPAGCEVTYWFPK